MPHTSIPSHNGSHTSPSQPKVMRKTIIITALICCCLMPLAACAAGIGSWSLFTSYNHITRIEPTGKDVFVCASARLYSYNPSDQSVTTYDRLNGLNGNDIALIRWNKTVKRLLIVYTDGNIDLLSADGSVTNIPDFYNKIMTEDKTVNGASVSGKYAYVCTGFGMIKVDMQRAEIADTYNIGQTCYDVTEYDGSLVVGTRNGPYRARLTDNLMDKASWKQMSPWRILYTFTIGEKLYLGSTNYLALYDAANNSIRQVARPPFSQVQKLDDRTILYGSGTTTMVGSGGDISTISTRYGTCCYDAASGNYWVSQTDGSLAEVTIATTGGDDTVVAGGIRPDGPATNAFGRIRFTAGTLYAVPGMADDTAIMTWDGSQWSAYDESFTDTLSHAYHYNTDIAIDPTDPSHAMVVGYSGVYDFQGGRLKNHWTFRSSPLMPAATVGAPGSKPDDELKAWTVVSAALFDATGKAWIANAISPSTSLFSIAKDGTWTAHHHSELMEGGRSMDEMRDMMFDSRGYMWFVNSYYTKPALIRYDTATDEIKVYSDFVNQDGQQLTLTAVRCVAEDVSHNIWIGTNVGPLMLRADDAASDGDTFYQVKVPRNDGTNLADYLLSGVDISSILVDGGGRKWMGTNTNGLYLISADNIVEEKHFTTDNSPMPSNTVNSLAMNGTTGELFVATPSGLCSYMTDSSQPSDNMTKDNVYAYPNPVRPDYTGLITVTGLSLDADVKIVTTNGVLVAEGRSSGGSFVWDGCDKRGKRVASGVYMVETATAEGGSGTVCKIAIVR